MTAKGEGKGSAADAAVSTDGDATIEQEDPRIAARAAVASAEAKVERQKSHLAGAEDALTEAQDALEAAEQAAKED